MGAPVREGDVLAGKYRIERVLGEGGMGVVVAATHLHLEQRVAIKFLLPQAMEIPEVVSRFAREARAAAKIQSEHVARVIDVSTLDGGAPYMVMEYLEGKDLAHALEERGTIPVQEAAEYALQACEALAEAHAAGIVHRDLKPANLFLAARADRRSIVKVLDFGISKALNATADAVQTKTSALMGSPFYMSPEQMTNTRNVDARSDIWAMGVILYELVTGKTPFFGETMPEIVAAILTSSPSPINDLRPGSGDEMQTVIDRCLKKDPKARFANVAELAAALAPLAGQEKAMLSVARISRVLGSEPPPATATPKSALPQIPPTLLATDKPSGESIAAAISVRSGGAAEAKTIGSATTGAWGGSAEPEKKKSGKGLLIGGAVAFAVVLVGGGALMFGNSTKNASQPTPDTTATTVTSAATASSAPVTPTTIEKLAPPEATVVVAPSAEQPVEPSKPKVDSHPATNTATNTGTHAPTHAPVVVTVKPVATAAPTTTSKSPLNIQLK